MRQAMRCRTYAVTALTKLGLIGVVALVLANGNSARAQTAPAVILDILNEAAPGTDQIIVPKGDPVLVAYDVNPAADTSASDLIRLDTKRAPSLLGRCDLPRTSAAQAIDSRSTG